MRLWITGAQGMLGSALVKRCRQRGIEHLATGRQEVDITVLSQVQGAVLGFLPTHIIHCAAFTHVDGAEQQQEEAFNINGVGAENVALSAQGAGAKMLYVSSDYVFDGRAAKPYEEGDVCAPVNVYGMSKWEGEKRVLQAAPDACIVRTSWVFGPKGGNFISSFMHWMREKEELVVVADQCSRPTYCGDLADALLEMGAYSGIYHFANTGAASRYEIAVELLSTAQALGLPVKCRKIVPVESSHFATLAQRPLFSVLSTDKIALQLGQTPRPWKEALKDYLQ